MPRRIILVLTLAALACGGESVAPVNAKLDMNPGPHGWGIGMGAVMQVPIGLFDSEGDSLEMPPGLTIVSRNPAVISVDSGRWIHARAPGLVWLVASVPFQGKTLFDSNYVSVTCALVLTVGITPSTITLGVGETGIAPTVIHHSCVGPVTLTALTWSSNDPTIATVDPTTGRATGIKVGVTFVRATSATFGNLPPVVITVR